ncbi:hypothetical protein FACS189427_00900 [Planctomycetales bacterium]|nr:hypothetical protein FACS189427_00900 [Planctomycetales bacterium]
MYSNFHFIGKIYTLRRNQDESPVLKIAVSGTNDIPGSKIKTKPVYETAFTGGTQNGASIEKESSRIGVSGQGTNQKSGYFFTAAAPLKDNNGWTEAIICIEFEYEDGFINNCFSLRLALLLALYLGGVWFFTCSKIYREKFRQQKEDLAESQKSSLAAVKAKSDFLANMSHEIRTPMNALLGFSNIIVQRMKNVCPAEVIEESEGILEIIQKSGQNLLAIINDILDFSRIEANLLQVESVPLSIKQVIEDVWQMEQDGIIAKHLDFSVRYKEPVPELILGDPIRLRQMLLNLVDNAVKFTNSGSVTLHCEAVPHKTQSGEIERVLPHSRKVPNAALLRIDVIDTGVGIDAEDIEKVFKPFTQVDQSSTRQFGGTGLGLSIARRLAQLMDGDITVVSTPHTGSTFTLQLNVFLPNEEQASDVLEKIRSKGSNSVANSDINYNSQSAQKAKQEGSGSTAKTDNEKDPVRQYPLRNIRILLVEDMLINQIVIATQLRDSGAKVEIADNGKLAVDRINQITDDGLFFDVVLMDMQMPIMDGYEATSLLRSQGYSRPIIAITAHALIGDKEKTIAVGCDNYIAKPVERQILIDMIKKYAK